MPFFPIPEPGFYDHIINRPEPTVVHLFDGSAGPSEEFKILDSGNHPGRELETFFLDVSQFSVPNAPSDVPVTILYGQGQQEGIAQDGDIPKLYELLERAVRGF